METKSSPSTSVVSTVPAPPTTLIPNALPLYKPPSASLYVGDLLPEVTEGTLFELFNNVGPVSSIRVCRDAMTKRSLGYGYVNFHSAVDAERALDSVNNQIIAGRPCRIMWSQRDPGIRKSGVGNIFIKNLDPSIGHKELYDTFSQFGNILSCKVALDDLGQSKGYGFVHFENQSAAELAVNTVNDNYLLGKKVYVANFVPRKLRIMLLEKSWTNVFIKDIDPEIGDAELNKAFSEFGVVTSAIVMRKPDGTHSGFGFVNFEDHDSAVKAVEKMHGQKLTGESGKAIYCCRAQKKAERLARLRKEWEQQKINKYQGINLYIKNIEDEVDEERLRKEFSIYGVIKSCKIMTDEKGNSKGFGFVCYSTPEESSRAINEMNNRILPGCNKPLYVALHEAKEVRRQKLSLNAMKGLGRAVPQGGHGAALYSTAGQPVFYPGGNMSQGYVYPQQMMASMPRGWPPQYQMHSAYPQGVSLAVQPRGGSATAGSGATRGRGAASARGASGTSSTRGRRQNLPQPVAATELPLAVAPNELTIEQVKQFAPEQQKLLLGERLYPEIALRNPTLAGKITGMFLDAGWTTDELYSLLTDEAKLTEKINEAVGVLQSAQMEPTEVEGV